MRWKKLYISCNSTLGDRKNSRATRTRWAILVARLIRFIYHIYNYRLLYYLPMERMINLARALDDERLIEKIEQLEEENKKLKSDLAFERTMLDNVRAEYESLQNIKEKLNIKVASLEWEIKWLNSVIDKLKEENQTLELWLDNKEKLNEEYRKQIDKLRTDNIYEEWLYD